MFIIVTDGARSCQVLWCLLHCKYCGNKTVFIQNNNLNLNKKFSLVTSVLGFKARVDLLYLHVASRAYNAFVRFTADLLVASMAAEQFQFH